MEWLDVLARVALGWVAVAVFGCMVYSLVTNWEIRRK
jgi:hypothetical protein